MVNETPKEIKEQNLTLYIYLSEDEELLVEDKICKLFPSMIPLVNKCAVKREFGDKALKIYPVKLLKEYIFRNYNSLVHILRIER